MPLSVTCSANFGRAVIGITLVHVAVPVFGGTAAPTLAAGRGRGRGSGVGIPPPGAVQSFGAPAPAPAPAPVVAAPAPAGRGRGRGTPALPMVAPPVGQPAQPYQVVIQRAAGGLGMVINSTVRLQTLPVCYCRVCTNTSRRVGQVLQSP